MRKDEILIEVTYFYIIEIKFLFCGLLFEKIIISFFVEKSIFFWIDNEQYFFEK